jgi:glycosyltransferase involved in cell wall biosynthesis
MCSAESHESISQGYVVISPVRNESRYIEKTLQSMANQTIPPNEWIIVNDGSTDNTAEIVHRYAQHYPWIKPIYREKREAKGDRQRGKGVIDTFYYGYDRLTSPEYMAIVKLDGDVSFDPTYFEFLLREFAAHPKLGIAGGGLYERTDGQNWSLRSAPDHVGGPAKTYKSACFDAIGGLEHSLGWDGIDEWKALSLGWQVKSFGELRVLHYRIMGNATGMLKSKIEQGYGAHYMGYHPLYTIFRGMRHMFMRPYLVGGLAIMTAHLAAWLQGREQFPDPAVIRLVRRTQLKQISGLLAGKRLYKS